MICPVCESPDTDVLETRKADRGRVDRRRHRCFACGRRWSSVTVVVMGSVTTKAMTPRTDPRRKTISTKVRFAVFKRDDFTCRYCGRKPPEVRLEVDHVIARAEGGPDSFENYATACADCNAGKGSDDALRGS